MARITLFLLLVLAVLTANGGVLKPSEPLDIDYDAMTRIVGGQPADVGEYPSQVSIRYSGVHNCGGTIISDRFILTAAHCVKIPGVELFTVAVGTTNWNQGTEYAILSATPHEGFNWTDFSSQDIGIIEVASPIQFNNVTQPAVMAEPFEETPGGSPAIIVGWGLMDENATLPPLNLQEANVTVRDHQECYNIYLSEVPITDAQICADVPEGGVGVCSGDSGGPLYVNGEIHGITSWSSNGCAAQGYPGVFTRVASYRDWIYNMTGV